MFFNEFSQVPEASFIANVSRLASAQGNGLTARTADDMGLGKEGNGLDREERNPLRDFPMFPMTTSLASVAVASACTAHLLSFFQPAKNDEQTYLSKILLGRFHLVAFGLQLGQRAFRAEDLM